MRAADDVAGSADEKTADVSVGITITDANDNYPLFSPASYTTTILETAAVAGTVITVTVSDDDTGKMDMGQVLTLSATPDSWLLQSRTCYSKAASSIPDRSGRRFLFVCCLFSRINLLF